MHLTLWPFTRREIVGDLRAEPFVKRFFEAPRLPAPRAGPPVRDREVLRGGMVSVCLGEAKDAALWFRGYEQTYLERDVRELARVSDLVGFRHLLRLAALRTGQIPKLGELGRDAKLNAATVSRHLGLMEASFAFHRLALYLANRASRLINPPKVHVTDSGLASHLGGLSDEASLRDEPLRGALWETYATPNLAATIDGRWPRAALSFWHVQGRYEVDFVVEAGRECRAIGVKSGSRWGDRELTGLRAWPSMRKRLESVRDRLGT